MQEETNGIPPLQEFKSGRLKRITAVGELFPDLSEDLDEFSRRFDRDRAEQEGAIVPFPGFEDDYDNLSKKIAEHEQELEGILQEAKKKFKSPKISFKNLGKNLYQIEIPTTLTDLVPREWTLMSSTKVPNSTTSSFCVDDEAVLDTEN